MSRCDAAFDDDRASPMTFRRFALAFAALLATPVVLALALLFWGLHEGVSDPVVRRVTILSHDPALRGRQIRLALVSDIHVGNAGMTPQRLARVVAEINGEFPDAVLLAGDFVNGHRPGDAEAKPQLLPGPLARLRAPLGIYAVLGNHDHSTDAGAVRRVLEAIGIPVLANQAVPLGPVTLVGLDPLAGSVKAMQKALDSAKAMGGVPVTFTHYPFIAVEPLHDMPLVFAGHNHCGQIVLPGLPLGRNPLTGHQLYDPRYRCGLVRDAKRWVLNTGGVGTGSTIVRIGAPPDFWIVTLRGAD